MNSSLARKSSNLKRKREYLSKNNSQLLKSYTSLQATKRVLFDENKQWTDFPPEAFLLAMGDFKKKKEVTEFSEVLFDFVHTTWRLLLRKQLRPRKTTFPTETNDLRGMRPGSKRSKVGHQLIAPILILDVARMKR